MKNWKDRQNLVSATVLNIVLSVIALMYIVINLHDSYTKEHSSLFWTWSLPVMTTVIAISSNILIFIFLIYKTKRLFNIDTKIFKNQLKYILLLSLIIITLGTVGLVMAILCYKKEHQLLLKSHL